MRKKTKNIIIFSTILLSIIFWGVLTYFFKPSEMIEGLGVTNSYLFIFLMAAISGVSSFTSSSHYLTVITFAIGGINPFMISLLAGIGLTIGDTVFYYLGKKGSKSLPKKINEKFIKINKWIENKPKILVPIIVYVYTGLTPLPGDFISIFLGVTNISYKRIVLPFILGNMTLMLLVSLFAQSIG